MKYSSLILKKAIFPPYYIYIGGTNRLSRYCVFTNLSYSVSCSHQCLVGQYCLACHDVEY